MRFFLVLVLFFSLTCCTDKAQKHSAKMLRINFQDGDLPSIHPHLGIDYRMRSLQSALFEGLTRMDKKGVPQPAAAEKINISDDQTRYTFTLRSSRWSNGEPVTAFQFEKAWKMAIATGSPCRRADLFYVIKNVAKAKQGKVELEEVGIHAVDEKTLVVLLEHPAPYFLELISNPIFAPIATESMEDPNLFNGPFLVDNWKRDEFIILKKNPLYWDMPNVNLEKVEILFITDPLTAVQLFEKGELDWIGSPFSHIPVEMIPALQKKYRLYTQEVARIYWLYCNTEVLPFNNASIRKALSFAINRNEIVEHVLLAQAAATTPLPSSLSLLNTDKSSCLANPSLALSFFKQGLQELGIASDAFPPIVLSYSHIAGQKQLAEVIQSNWQKTLGIKVHLSGAEWNVFFSNLSKGKFQIGGCIKSALFRDPIYHLELLQDKAHAYNVCRWEDPVYQSLLVQARLSTNEEERRRLLRETEEILIDQMPVIPIYSEVYLYMIQPSIKGIIVQDMGHVDFKWISLSS
jgi:oligopeptide transport system substrate-binding protein